MLKILLATLVAVSNRVAFHSIDDLVFVPDCQHVVAGFAFSQKLLLARIADRDAALLAAVFDEQVSARCTFVDKETIEFCGRICDMRAFN